MTTTQSRKGFTFYRSYYEALSLLPQKEQLAMYKMIMSYALDGIEPDEEQFSAPCRMLWTIILPNLTTDRRRYTNGLLGGAPKGSVNNPKGNNQHTLNKEDNQEDNKEDNQEDNQADNQEDNQRKSNVNVNVDVDEKVKEKENVKVYALGEGSSPRGAKLRFEPPTIEDIKNYIHKQGYTDIDPHSFVDYYTSVGWKIGGQRMCDWKAALRRWHTHNKQSTPTTKKLTRNEPHNHSANPTSAPRLFRNLDDADYLAEALPRRR